MKPENLEKTQDFQQSVNKNAKRVCYEVQVNPVLFSCGLKEEDYILFHCILTSLIGFCSAFSSFIVIV